MINQNFIYECDINDLEEGKKLIKEIEDLMELGINYESKRIYKDKLSGLIGRMINKRSDFMMEKENEVISKIKKAFNLEEASFQELFEKVPMLTEYFRVKFQLNPDCEDMIDKLINLFGRLI